jgi:molecular chaperone Hsp33
MKDYIVRVLAADATVRAYGATTLHTVQKAMDIHHLSPASAAALGRALTATALMTKMMENEKDKLTLQVRGNGPIDGIVVVSDTRDAVRGYVGNPNVPLYHKPNGKISGEIADDLASYFVTSEQIPTAFSLGETIDKKGTFTSCGGYIIQLMPGATEETLSLIEQKIYTYPAVSELLSGGDTIENVLQMILGSLDMKIIDTSPVEYRCTCSRFRMETNILALGKEEIMDIIDTQDIVETQCNFCNKKYQFTKEELLDIIKH